jgi:microcystin-dependent protein
MAVKRITELPLIGTLLGTFNIGGDNTIQAYRCTVEQIKNFVLATGNVTRSAIEESQRLPIGAIFPFAGSSAPTGYLMCDGSAVSRTTYSALFAILAETHGEGDGSTTFNLPDYRGRFLRGVDGGAARDGDAASRTAMATGGNTGDAVGTLQGEKTKLPTTPFTVSSGGAHTHAGTTNNPINGVKLSGSGVGGNGGSWVSSVDTMISSGAHTHTIDGGGDSETRPINASVNYIIKV